MSHSDQHPKISIIIVTLNVANVLQNCLDSIYRQTYPNIEIIIMDGASTDGTVDILKANDSKIIAWKSEKDGGIYAAMNKAIEYVTGEWAYFLGADDTLLDDFSTMCCQLKDHSVIYYSNVMTNKGKYRGKVNAYQHAKGTICHQAIIYPKEVFVKHRFNTSYKISADHVFNMECWREFKFKYIDLTIAFFSDTGISSLRIDGNFEREKLRLIFKYHGFGTGLRYAFRLIKENLNPKAYLRPIPTNDDF